MVETNKCATAVIIFNYFWTQIAPQNKGQVKLEAWTSTV